MGSFTEVCLSFDFAESTPDYVLAAFSGLPRGDEVRHPPLSRLAPPLPAPVVEAWEDFAPDWREFSVPGDNPVEHEPWRHDWAYWVSLTMGGGTTPHGLLTWSKRRWHLDCRCDWKTGPDVASEALAWLAPFVEPRGGAYRNELGEHVPKPTLVGYALYAPRPHLFWVKDGRWEVDDLNPRDWLWD